jgi:hypothetical protein
MKNDGFEMMTKSLMLGILVQFVGFREGVAKNLELAFTLASAILNGLKYPVLISDS